MGGMASMMIQVKFAPEQTLLVRRLRVFCPTRLHGGVLQMARGLRSNVACPLREAQVTRLELVGILSGSFL